MSVRAQDTAEREDARVVLPRSPEMTLWIIRVFLTDLVVLDVAMVTGMLARFGLSGIPTTGGNFMISYTVLGVLLTVGWLVALSAFGTRDPRILADGSEEFRRLLHATLITFGTLGIFSLAFKVDMSRGYLAVAFPLGLVGLLTGRIFWRSRLRKNRAQGRLCTNVLVIGGVRGANQIAVWLRRHPASGLRVTGVWVPDGDVGDSDAQLMSDNTITVMGTSRRLPDALEIAEARLVIVSDTDHLGHHGLKDLTWELEDLRVELMVSPNVIDVASSRISLVSVAAMPFLTVREPQYAAASTWRKVAFDRVTAALLVVLALPVLVAAAVAVKLSSPGSVLYRQERIGQSGRPFGMLKFRSMRADSDAELHHLLAASGQESGPLAKIQHDPRITPAGRFLRRYSIDELPQLFNVLSGDMSLVGPRPQRDFEVAAYDHRAYRRLRVRPGMTGLWQVSGRSDLSWEDAIRLDNYYVENWSMTGDLQILWRTVRAVFAARGAY